MAYRFRLKESIPNGVRRIGREQINTALSALSQSENIHQAIHRARKRIKCIRSLLYLIRPGLEDSVFMTEDRDYKDLGRRLSNARDAQVMLETLTRLESWADNHQEIGNCNSIRAWLYDRHREAEQRLDESMILEILGTMGEKKKHFSKLSLKQIDLQNIVEGAKTTYKRGRRAFLRAVETQNGEDFHDWRKSEQRHWRHTQLLRPCWPQMIDMRARYAHELSRLLGDDHDLEVFGAMLDKHGDTFAPKVNIDVLLRCKDIIQEDLRASAKTHGQILYAEKPRHFQQRLTTCWNASVKI